MAGSIRAKADGVWELRTYAGMDPLTGKERQISRTYRGSRRGAEKALAELVTSTSAGRHRGTASTFGELLDAWLDDGEAEWSPTTTIGYRRVSNRYLRPALAGKRLDRLGARDFDQVYRAMTKTGLKPATVHQAHAVARRACEKACDWGWLTVNPVARATPPKKHKTKVRPPTTEAANVVLARAREVSLELGLFVRLAAATGMRRGELCGLRWGSIDVDAGTVVVSRAVVFVAGEAIDKSTKTHAERLVRLDPVTVAMLVEQLAAMRTLAKGLGRRWSDKFWVVPQPGHIDEPYRPDTLTAQFRRVADASGLEGVRLHDLRHYQASVLLDSGLPLPAVSARLGHATTSITADVYSHPMGDVDGRAATAIGELLPGKATVVERQ